MAGFCEYGDELSGSIRNAVIYSDVQVP